MKIIRNKIIPFGKRFYAVNLFGVLFAKGPCDRRTINHEKIHTAQIRELLFLPFYLIYVVEWLVRSAQFGGLYNGYRNISFEREAYMKEADFEYLKTRKPFSFRKYFRRPKTVKNRIKT